MSRGATGERGTGFLVDGDGTYFAIARDYRKDRRWVKGGRSGKSSVSATGTLVGGGGSDAQDGESRFGADTVRGYDSLVWVLVLERTRDCRRGSDAGSLGSGRNGCCRAGCSGRWYHECASCGASSIRCLKRGTSAERHRRWGTGV